jgi:hypothetical protein
MELDIVKYQNILKVKMKISINKKQRKFLRWIFEHPRFQGTTVYKELLRNTLTTGYYVHTDSHKLNELRSFFIKI